MAIIFWLSAGMLFLHYVGYPLLMACLAKIKKSVVYPVQEELPFITMIISAYNEDGVIGERLENCLALDYPQDKLKIIVVSDGSTDNTHSIVQQYRQHGVELIVVEGRVGKTEALNQVIPTLDTEIVIFTDANSMLNADALTHIVRPFLDTKVGAVCGELHYRGDSGLEGAYWRYEKAIKQWESKVFTLTVLNGALYALRRCLHQPMNPKAANDFQHPLQVALQGYRSVYAPQAIATEEVASDERIEARRRVRIISRGWRGLASNLRVLNPFRAGIFSLQFVARKLLRWLGPIFMITVLATNIFLVSNHDFYKVTLLLQGIFYAAALLGLVLKKMNLKFLPTHIPYYFCLINWAALKALFSTLSGRDFAVWTPTTKYDESRQDSSQSVESQEGVQ